MKKLLSKYREIIAYLIVGVLTTVVSWGTYALLRLIIALDNPFQVQVAVVLRWVAGVAFAYITNRIFVFQSKNPQIIKEALQFASSRVITLLLDMLIMWLMVTIMHLNDWVATLTSSVIVTILNYLFSKILVFKK